MAFGVIEVTRARSHVRLGTAESRIRKGSFWGVVTLLGHAPFNVCNQNRWDTLDPEGVEVGRRFDELPESFVVAPSPLDCLKPHALSS